MSDDPQMIYEHGEPTGHTSWGPDPEGEMPDIPQAMVEAALAEYRGNELSTDGLRRACLAFVAAAPPEWLLRAALTEDEIMTILGYGVAPDGLITQINEKFRRALRGGENENQ